MQMKFKKADIILDLSFSAGWPDAHIGILAVYGIRQTEDLKSMDLALSKMIETAFHHFPDREALMNSPTMQAYRQYYKVFNKSYHVLAQVESVLFKGKPIPFQNPLVTAMFAAEIKNMLLTAGHDLNKIQLPITINASNGTEAYISISGKEVIPKSNDMMIQDRIAPISSVIHGPDARTRLTKETEEAIFTVYAPAGIPLQVIQDHLADIFYFIELFSPTVQKILLATF